MSALQVGRGAVAALVGEDGLAVARRRTASRGSWTAPSARARSSRRGPRRTDRARGSARRSAPPSGRLSLALTPTKAISLPRLGGELLQDRQLRAARPAPGGPLVDHDGVAAQLAQARLEVLRACRPGSRWPDRAARPAARAPRRARAAPARGRTLAVLPGCGPVPACLRQADDKDGHEGDGGEQHQGPFHRRSGSHTGAALRHGCFNGSHSRAARFEGAQPLRHPARRRAREGFTGRRT